MTIFLQSMMISLELLSYDCQHNMYSIKEH